MRKIRPVNLDKVTQHRRMSKQVLNPLLVSSIITIHKNISSHQSIAASCSEYDGCCTQSKKEEYEYGNIFIVVVYLFNKHEA